MNLRYTETEKDCWEHLYLLGFSSGQIANLRGVKTPSVTGYIKSLGISRTLSEAQTGREPWNKGKKGSQVPWNKGKKGVQISTRKGTTQPKRGPRKPEHVQRIKETWRKRIESGWDGFGGFGKKPSPEQRLLPGTLYLIRYIDPDGIHYKIGITKCGLHGRFRPEQIDSVIRLWEMPLGQCFDIEQEALKYAKGRGWRYKSSTTTELLCEEGVPSILDFIEEWRPR